MVAVVRRRLGRFPLGAQLVHEVAGMVYQLERLVLLYHVLENGFLGSVPLQLLLEKVLLDLGLIIAPFSYILFVV